MQEHISGVLMNVCSAFLLHLEQFGYCPLAIKKLSFVWLFRTLLVWI